MASASGYPVQLDLDAPLKVARWRALFQWVLAIPHVIIFWVLNTVLNVLGIVTWFAILFTGAIPRGLFDFMVTIYRYQWRTFSYLGFMRETYPPFDFTATSVDPGTDPARVSIEYPERSSRGLIFVKWLLLIPHIIVLMFIIIGAYVAAIVGFFAVLITGRWPEGLRNYLVGTARWGMRISAYFLNLTDVYPPFSLQP